MRGDHRAGWPWGLVVLFAGSGALAQNEIDGERFKPAITHDGFVMTEGTAVRPSDDRWEFGGFINYCRIRQSRFDDTHSAAARPCVPSAFPLNRTVALSWITESPIGPPLVLSALALIVLRVVARPGGAATGLRSSFAFWVVAAWLAWVAMPLFFTLLGQGLYTAMFPDRLHRVVTYGSIIILLLGVLQRPALRLPARATRLLACGLLLVMVLGVSARAWTNMARNAHVRQYWFDYSAHGSYRDAFTTGFECRWRPIPSRRGAVVSLLVQACGEDPAGTYRRVLEAIQSILAEAALGRPVHPSTLLLQRFGDTFDQEAKIRGGAAKGYSVLARSFVAKLASSIGSALLARGWNALGFPGAVYRDEVVANTDFRKFDDTLRVVIDIGPEQQRAVESMLAAEHAAGHLVYGIHESPSSIMTCAIGDYHGDHVHFVDGADGGYALAAKAMKKQQRQGA